MTEAVCLALIALCGLLVFSTTLIILVKVVLQKAPSYFKFITNYGECVIDFNNKADK